jgi:hypothetical protein
MGELFGKVAVVALVLAVLVAAAVGSCRNLDECQRDGHSFGYCYQLLYGRR